MKTFKARIHQKISEIGKPHWSLIEAPDFPFADYEFLVALEDSGCVGEGTGWLPLYISLWDETSELVAGLYSYIKTDSYGEYIFDWAWAEGAQRAGIPYYPKWIAACPFTPAVGPKFLIRAGAKEPDRLRSQLVEQVRAIAAEAGLNSEHYLFIEDDEVKVLEDKGFSIRHTHQFHWSNQNYKTFEDFLLALKQKRAKEIRRERRKAFESNLHIEDVTANLLKDHHASEMYKFYLSTIEKKWSQDYLNLQFFEQIFATMKDRIHYFRASLSDGLPLAGSLALQKGKKLYGRYWGAEAEVKHLHFELCYYQLLEWAIAHNIQVVEAGAQGPQKLARGFLPVITKSAHRIGDPRLGHAVSEFIIEEKKGLAYSLDAISDSLPFRSDGTPGP